MLSCLRVQNFAIVDEVEIEFGSGLNVLTGETGAGKSIIIRAIDLLTGKRTTAPLVRSGADAAEIEGLYFLPIPVLHRLREENSSFECFLDGEEVLIRRVIDRSGRSKIYLNGRLITAALLQHLSSMIIDITGQHEHQTLLESDCHLKMLDAFGVPQDVLERTLSAFLVYDEAAKELELYCRSSDAIQQRLERLEAEREELEKAGLEADERERLEGELSRLAHVETLAQNVSQCLELIEGGEINAEGMLRSAAGLLEASAAIDSKLAGVLALAESSSVQLSEAKLCLLDYAAKLEADPERIEWIRARIAEIARLERKFGKKTPELLLYLDEIATELSKHSAGKLDVENLKKRAAEFRAALDLAEAELHQSRLDAAKKLKREVESELASLNMKKALFEVEISPAPSSQTGADRVEFLLAANPGEPAYPLAKVASGGELSRVMLVLKSLINSREEALVQVFDEIDAGIGGAVAQVVGEKLRSIAKRSQTIVITHSPQISALGDQHFVIEKKTSDAATKVSIRKLNYDERIKEIARMLAGKRVSSNFEDSARELLGMTSAPENQ